MDTPSAVTIEIKKLEALPPNASASKYSPSLAQVGHYLLNTPGSLVDKNILYSLEFILTKLFNLFRNKYEDIELQEMIGKTKNNTSELCKTFRDDLKLDNIFFEKLDEVGGTLETIDARVKRFQDK
jgi:hypothetical protein